MWWANLARRALHLAKQDVGSSHPFIIELVATREMLSHPSAMVGEQIYLSDPAKDDKMSDCSPSLAAKAVPIV